ncbi:hypothetical protein GJ496_004375 [Pomphorhynchus laevis]|nr:hypothetical protein GJ496_004375 [Pomphorhynchus laevis]
MIRNQARYLPHDRKVFRHYSMRINEKMKSRLQTDIYGQFTKSVNNFTNYIGGYFGQQWASCIHTFWLMKRLRLFILLTSVIFVLLLYNGWPATYVLTCSQSIKIPAPNESGILCPSYIHGPHNHGFKQGNFDEIYNSHLISRSHSNVIYGGSWSPKSCLPDNEPILIIVPIRGRAKHLHLFLTLMHNFIQMQNIPYKIVTVSQTSDKEWNKGILVNMGVLHAPSNANCFIIYDVDMIPDRYENMFTCNQCVPKSLTSAVSYWNYNKVSNTNFGGIVALTRRQYFRINGFSTMFWGWGEEDNDAYRRCEFFYKYIERVPYSVGKISHLDHTDNERGEKNHERYLRIRQASYDYTLDGLSNTHTICNLSSVIEYPLRTHILVDCKRPPESVIASFLGIKNVKLQIAKQDLSAINDKWIRINYT